MGYAATIAMRISDGETIFAASRFSACSAVTLRRGRVTFSDAVAASMTAQPSWLEGLQGLVDLPVGLLEGRLRRLLPGERLVDVLVDRRGDLRVHRRDRARLGLGHRLLQLVGERERLLDVRVVVGRLEHRRQRVLRGVALDGLGPGQVVDERDRALGVLRVRRDHEVVPAEDAGLAAALELWVRGDLELALDLRGLLTEGVGVGPVAHERRAGSSMYVVTAFGGAPDLMPSTMNWSALTFSGELISDFEPSSLSTLPPAAKASSRKSTVRPS